jgi:hypothetical protein
MNQREFAEAIYRPEPGPASSIDPRRLARAVHLDAERDGPAGWLVRGGAESHRVTFDGDRYDCGCRDRAIRGGGCKHILRVLLSEGHPVVVRVLRALVRLPNPRRGAV